MTKFTENQEKQYKDMTGIDKVEDALTQKIDAREMENIKINKA